MGSRLHLAQGFLQRGGQHAGKAAEFHDRDRSGSNKALSVPSRASEVGRYLQHAHQRAGWAFGGVSGAVAVG